MTPTGSPYERWWLHFQPNSCTADQLPWDDSYQLSGAELRVVAPAIQQFQIGEFGRGRGLRRRATQHSSLSSDRWFLPALDLFIAEEQNHSRILGKFLDRERIPRLQDTWLDIAFRRLRKLAGLEVCISVLATAEVLAMPFYQALREATNSPLLRAICNRILRDEGAHLKYQALTLSRIRGTLRRLRGLHYLGHALLFQGTALVVWQQHRVVFRAAGWTFAQFWRDAAMWFGALTMARPAGTLLPEKSRR